MRKKNKIGTISLISAFTGFVFIQIGIYFGWLQGNPWIVLSYGFEAGTIGGIADWYAVRALFREIPIPIKIIRKHTNIIVNNRDQLTDGVVELITQKWLSPKVINDKLASWQMAEMFVEMLKDKENYDKAIDLLRHFLGKFAESVDEPEVSKLLQKILKDQIEAVDIATPLGGWLSDTIKNGEHIQLWTMILESAQNAIKDDSTRIMLIDKAQGMLQGLKHDSLFKHLFISLGELFGGVDKESVANKFIQVVNDFINEIKDNPLHPLRKRFDDSILEFANSLANGDIDAHATINSFKKKLIDNAEGNDIIHGLLTRFKFTMVAQLTDNNSQFMSLMAEKLNRLLSELEKDLETQHKIDIWLRKTIADLMDDYKFNEVIGKMVKESLEKLSPEDLVKQIEDKVGNDLQYIRLNGAVVGGLAGVLISLIKLIFFKI